MAEILIDTRELAPPEPFELIMAALRGLGTGDWIHMWHRHEPLPLYSHLPPLGFTHACMSGGESGEVHVLIWRPADAAATAAVSEMIALGGRPASPC